ncbi:SusC/RagA family TonB-linked outer membrane protein [Panacibacter sp. DH6]|uniref:SusC/RagA family TonB-linked outer membrane protein n=1 Tax=Panacibacter microcysteis TaxID=2793269 RepID=A0A931E3B3_9BACT|nr:SusC/RagA family TonB-linked outer membrane protein [Panacibacter microcysteis]MBG9376293.1 SusC/RagA family TonB-linked outer membrane protein [Panacibacter microcysteis]
MTTTRLLRVLLLCPLLLLIMQQSWAQNKTVTGKVSDEKGSPVAGASVLAKGTSVGTSTDATGSFTLNVPASTNTLVISYVGYVSQEVSVSSATNVAVTLQPESSALNDVVVVGYGTVKKKDLTGAVATVREKDFNKGNFTAPDQLIQGKVAGVQVLNNSGQPGGASTVKIRGNSSIRAGSQPLYVVDGVPLDGRSARPGGSGQGIGTSPDANPLNFINPNDIASIDVLKDASATAIYGSRAAYGVIIITTKRGKVGQPKLDINSNIGTSSILKRIETLNGDEYRKALSDYGLTSGDNGDNVDAFDAILRNGFQQNYSVAMSGGTENGRYRLSAGYLDQQGIILKSAFKKVSANFSGNYKFLDSKKLGLDVNIITTQTREDIPPVSNDAGFTGNIVGQALQWNPTQALYNDDGSLNILRGSTTVNPVAMSEAYDDVTKVTTVLASISPYYKITKDLEYRFLYSINYGTGIRRSQIASFINLENIIDRGFAYYGNNELTTQQITHTLNFNKELSSNLSLNALVGYEYMRFDNKGTNMSARDFGTYPIAYTNYFQYSSQASRGMGSFADPTTELQSYFGRAILNLMDKYRVTATLRADGSSKFGENNRYGYFPSFAASWTVSNEEFFKGVTFVNSLVIRGGWGKTGTQDVPAGSSKFRYTPNGIGSIGLSNYQNSDLKWQADQQTNIGADFGLFKNRITATVDYFKKTTTGLLYPTVTPQPAPPGAPPTWKNLDGTIVNKGVEVTLNTQIINKNNFSWDFGINATFVKNNVSGLPAPIQTGSLSGQGISGATAQVIQNDLPVNAFFTKQYQGLDKDGFAIYTDDGYTLYYVGNPNPTTILGLSTSLSYKKLSFTANMNGAFGQDIYNNTLNTVLPIGNLGSRNIAKSLIGLGESRANPISPSSRYLEKGNYMKLANATFSYNVGSIGKVFKSMNVFVTGTNLFVITKFTGFDPEVNTDKNVNGVPSVGIEYTPYPSARTFLFGLNFSL